MAKPYSNDLRQRVARAIASGDSCRAIAEQYEIAPSTVVKWSKRVRETLGIPDDTARTVALVLALVALVDGLVIYFWDWIFKRSG